MPNPSNLNPVWTQNISIGTSLSSSTWTYAQLCAGIESCAFSVNEQNQQQFFLCGQGGANNEVTGIAPQITITGRRIWGDTAQDHIAGLQYSLGQNRKSSVKIEEYDGTTLKRTVTSDCTITDIVVDGGNTTDVVPFSCIIRLNGLPTVTDAH